MAAPSSTISTISMAFRLSGTSHGSLAMARNVMHNRRAKRSLGAWVFSTLSAIGTALVAIPATGILPPLLLYNPSQSAPPGWYRIEEIDEISRGDLLVANLPEKASELAAKRGYLPFGIPVIKTAFAIEGDTICDVESVLQINGTPTVRVLRADKAGRPLPSSWKHCRTLQADEVLLLSDRAPDSFDGRYFGTVRRTDIIGRAVWMPFVDRAGSGDMVKETGGRTECKIKADGANEGLVPCLHIDFYGSVPESIAPSSERMPNEDDRIGWLHSGDLACFPPEQPE